MPQKKGKEKQKEQKKGNIEIYFERGEKLPPKRAKKGAQADDNTQQVASMALSADKPDKPHTRQRAEEEDESVLGVVSMMRKELKDWKSELIVWQKKTDSRIKGVEDKLVKHKETIDGLQTSIEHSEKNAKEAIDLAKVTSTATKNLETKVVNLESEIGSWKTRQVLVQNRKERENRELNIRVLGMEEEDNENCKKATVKLFTEVYGSLKETHIDFAYRVGKKKEEETRPRPLVMRFKERKIRNNVFKEARKNKAKLGDIKVTDDLTKLDVLLRNQANPQIKDAIDQGKIAFFTRGRIKISGIFVPIADEKTVIKTYVESIKVETAAD